MRHRSRALLLAALVVVLWGALGVPGYSSSDRRARDKEAIRNHIESIFRAYIDGDREKIRATHDMNWTGFFRTSRSAIHGIDEYMLAAEAVLTTPSRMTDYQMLEFDVVFYGEIAIVPYIAKLKVQVGDVLLTPRLRVLDIYANRGDDWIQVASHTTAHPDTLAVGRQQPAPISPDLRAEILADREAIWRAWFANDEVELTRLLPEETIAINAGNGEWQGRAQVLAESLEFARDGARLAHLEFPRTEIQLYGDVAILYTTYLFETENGEQHRESSGRGTEIFVRRDGRWVNVGWHLDSGS